MARLPLLLARPHDLRLPKFTITGATARPHPLNSAPARLGRPRDGLGASARYTSVWRVRAPLLARAHGRVSSRWPWRVCTLALGALGLTTGRSARSRLSDCAPAMDCKRKFENAKRKGKLAMPPTRKSPRLAGLLPFEPPTSPKSMLRSNKLLPKKAVVIDLVSDEEEEARDKETATEEPHLVANQAKEEEEEEDPKEYPPPYSPLPPFPPSPELGPGEGGGGGPLYLARLHRLEIGPYSPSTKVM
ncbi:hypothetical protein PIB30_030498 [Stylosanthes scabra]|uniref:Uncharacterized protein n=1 Tax=Stylosanthes scabra TaxID=79078 RepID=A0ABU6W9Y3_9FABA|nr:hypothetical protein [Stylosanthes scabra]